MTVNTTATKSPVDTDDLLSTLAERRRRVVLRSLEAATGNERSVETLAEDVVDSLGDGDPADRPIERRIVTELHHNHLPALEEKDLIVHDRDAGVVWGDVDESALELLALIEQFEAAQ